jgi:hypothetical protein
VWDVLSGFQVLRSSKFLVPRASGKPITATEKSANYSGQNGFLSPIRHDSRIVMNVNI